jgi:hypothetical protein
MSPQLKEDLATARAKLDDMNTAIGSTKIISDDTSDLVEKAKKNLRPVDDVPASSPKQTKPEASTEPRALPQVK